MTATVDIKDSELMNLIVISNFNLVSLTSEVIENLIKERPFILYKGRMGTNFTTIQIPIAEYCLFLGHQLVL